MCFRKRQNEAWLLAMAVVAVMLAGLQLPGPLNFVLAQANPLGPRDIRNAQRQLAQIASSGGSYAICRQSSELEAAFANQSITHVQIVADIILADEDWARSPVTLQRNVTVVGGNEDRAHWFVLDLNFIKEKILLTPGNELVFTQLVLNRWREGPHFTAPGFDLVASGPVPEVQGEPWSAWPLVTFRQVFFIMRACTTISSQMVSATNIPRPSLFPGHNAAITDAPQEGCVADCPTVTPTQRCWSIVTKFVDIASYGMNFDSFRRPVQAGYVCRMVDCDGACTEVMTDLCVSQYGNSGCFYARFNTSPPTDATYSTANNIACTNSSNSTNSTNTSNTSNTSNDGGVRVGAVVGGVLGGVALVAIATAAAVAIFSTGWPRRTRPGGGAGRPNGPKDGTSTGAGRRGAVNADGTCGRGSGGGTPADDIESDETGLLGNCSASPGHPGFIITPPIGPLFPPKPAQAQRMNAVEDKGIGGGSRERIAVAVAEVVIPSGVAAGPVVANNGSHSAALLTLASDGDGGKSRSQADMTGTATTPFAAKASGRLCSSAGTSTMKEEGTAGCIQLHRPMSSSEAPDDASLVPVTSLTPLQSHINLNVRVDSAELRLTATTLGKGAFGRVVLGMYGGVPVAVKVIDHGLLPSLRRQAPAGGGAADGDVAVVMEPKALTISAGAAARANPAAKDADDAGGDVGGLAAVDAPAAAAVASTATRKPTCTESPDGAAASSSESVLSAGFAGLLGAARQQQEQQQQQDACCVFEHHLYDSASTATTADIGRCVLGHPGVMGLASGEEAAAPEGGPADAAVDAIVDVVGVTRGEGGAAGCLGPSGAPEELLCVDSGAGPMAAAGGDQVAVTVLVGGGKAEAATAMEAQVTRTVAEAQHTFGAAGTEAAVMDVVVAAEAEEAAAAAAVVKAADAAETELQGRTGTELPLKTESCTISTLKAATIQPSSPPVPPPPPPPNKPIPSGSKEEDLLEASLRQEVEVLARCQHPNIVRLLAACLKPPKYCLVMELMDASLERLLYGTGRKGSKNLLPLDTVLHIGIQIAKGLSYLHPTIVHRDLKPANVLISSPERPHPVAKLADFGLARLRNTVLVTRHPEVGTVPYIAPEAFDVTNYRITDRADIYALGVILWEMLSGQRPWAGINIVRVALAVSLHRQRLPLEAVPEGRCPPKLRALIAACWEHEPARRPAAADVAKTLALLQQQQLSGGGFVPCVNAISGTTAALPNAAPDPPAALEKWRLMQAALISSPDATAPVNTAHYSDDTDAAAGAAEADGGQEGVAAAGAEEGRSSSPHRRALDVLGAPGAVQPAEQEAMERCADNQLSQWVSRR